MVRDIRAVLSRWGTWAAGEEKRSDWPPVCAMLAGVLPHSTSRRPSCCDDDGLIIDACVSCLRRTGNRDEQEVLYAYYVLGFSHRDAAGALGMNRQNVRALLASGESFVNGCLCMKGVRLDMDLLVAAPAQSISADCLPFDDLTVALVAA